MPSDTETTKGRVLTIAGSDSGGGAGVQADIKTITAVGSYAMTAITAITAQDTLGVHGVWAMPTEAVAAQIKVTLADIGADAIKTGMLGNKAMVECVAEALSEAAKGVPRIVDPVMVATSGDRLLDESAVGAMRALMLPGAKLVTPNAPEAEILTGKAVESVDGQRRTAEVILEAGALGALVKGGHIEGGVITDVLQTTHGEWIYESERIDTRSTHGTGCTLASAIAAYVAQGLDLPEAVGQARTYVQGAIRNAPGLGAGHGPLDHGWRGQEE